MRIGQDVCDGRVLEDWIDVNAHMNVAYYVLAFDHGVDALWRTFGIDEDYIRDHRQSTFAVEAHVTYQREMNLHDPYVITTQVLAYDAKRIHQFQRMYHAERDYLAATCEWMNLHVDLSDRKVSPWPDDVRAAIARFAKGQQDTNMPGEAGRRMTVREPLFAVGGY
ncbi:MAG: thioesterase family protein [Woeseiaceae bacterium]|nr:thioesterase family protein [Woeseiaceae bacterium]